MYYNPLVDWLWEWGNRLLALLFPAFVESPKKVAHIVANLFGLLLGLGVVAIWLILRFS